MTLAQAPNKELMAALAAAVLSYFIHGELHALLSGVFYLALGIWAYLEATTGANWFRRSLGIVFIFYILYKLMTQLSPT